MFVISPFFICSKEGEEMVKVSVLVPTHNSARYIDQCMMSLVNQTLENIEIIVCDNGSTDRTREILERYAKKCDKVKVLLQEDKGQANSCNRMLREARGEYVAECDSDDFVSFTCYEKLYEAAKKHKADCVRCGFFGVWDDGRLQPNQVMVDDWCDKPINPLKLEEDHYPLVFGRMNALWAGLYKRTFLLNNGLFYREGKNFEDTSLEYKIRASAKRYVFVNEFPYYYRQDNPNCGRKTIHDIFAINEQFEEITRFTKENNLPFGGYMNVNRYYTYMWALSRIGDVKEQEEFLKRAGKDFRENPADNRYFHNDTDRLRYEIIKNSWRE